MLMLLPGPPGFNRLPQLGEAFDEGAAQLLQ
jgi:hypothetical protein